MILFIFSFTGCYTYKLPNAAADKTTTADITIRETTETTAPEATVPTINVPETTATVATAKGKIAFVSNRDGNYEIYIMNADGSDQVNLTNLFQTDDVEPSFSP